MEHKLFGHSLEIERLCFSTRLDLSGMICTEGAQKHVVKLEKQEFKDFFFLQFVFCFSAFFITFLILFFSLPRHMNCTIAA